MGREEQILKLEKLRISPRPQLLYRFTKCLQGFPESQESHNSELLESLSMRHCSMTKFSKLTS